MVLPLRQSMRTGRYLIGQKLRRRKKFALLLELEPLFACNLECVGCGKIQQPATCSAPDAGGGRAAAVEECGRRWSRSPVGSR